MCETMYINQRFDKQFLKYDHAFKSFIRLTKMEFVVKNVV